MLKFSEKALTIRCQNYGSPFLKYAGSLRPWDSGWWMMSECILGDGFVGRGDDGYSSNSGPRGGCFVLSCWI
jgi:hypothetical protein